MSAVTWDSEAQLSIDPTIIGSSIEAYLSGRLAKLDEEENESLAPPPSDFKTSTNPPQRPKSLAIRIIRTSTKAKIKDADNV